MATVLVIQGRTNRGRIDQEKKRFIRLAKGIVKLKFVNFLDPQSSKDWNDSQKMLQDIDGVLITGSGDIDLSLLTEARNKYVSCVTPVIKESIKRANRPSDPIPILGICLGHQIVHMVLGGKVEDHPERQEIGTITTCLTISGARHRYFEGVVFKTTADARKSIKVNHGHHDAVVKPGRGLRVYGWTNRDEFSITGNGNIFTAQGHIELFNKVGFINAMNTANVGREKAYELNFPLSNTDTGKVVINFYKDVARRAEKRQARQE